MILSLALVALTPFIPPTVAEQVSATATEMINEKRAPTPVKQPIDPLSWHHAYGWAMYILVAMVLIVGMIGRLSSYISYIVVSHKHTRSNADLPAGAQPAAAASGVWCKLTTMYRRHISAPATFGRKHLTPVGHGMFSIPTRLQAIMIFAFVTINVIFSFTDYRIVEGKGAKSIQLGKQIGDRAGIMAFYNFPLLFALAGRNDVLIWVTGWSYRNMNLFHRWAARMAVLHAIVHSAAYTWLNRSNLAVKFRDNYFWGCAIFATVVLSMMVPMSIRPLRAKFYELFLVVHIIMALAVLVLLFHHVRVVGGSYNLYLWTCVGFWAFDRTVRFLRVVVLSFRTLNVTDKGKNAVARIADNKTGLMRLSIDTSVALSPTAGQYFFLYTPWSYTPWQSHPFSLASWEPSASGSGTTLHFMIAPRGGATKRLHDKIEKTISRSAMLGLDTTNAPLRVLLEGPYGCRHPVHKYDHVLLVAGGTGITAMLPYVFELARLGHKNVSLAWIVRDSSYANDVLAHELSPERRGHANIIVFSSSAGSIVRLDANDTVQAVNEKSHEKSLQYTGKKVVDDESDSFESDESASKERKSCDSGETLYVPGVDGGDSNSKPKAFINTFEQARPGTPISRSGTPAFGASDGLLVNRSSTPLFDNRPRPRATSWADSSIAPPSRTGTPVFGNSNIAPPSRTGTPVFGPPRVSTPISRSGTPVYAAGDGLLANRSATPVIDMQRDNSSSSNGNSNGNGVPHRERRLSFLDADAGPPRSVALARGPSRGRRMSTMDPDVAAIRRPSMGRRISAADPDAAAAQAVPPIPRSESPCIDSPSRPATPFDGVSRNDPPQLKPGDLMAHLVKKKKFLSADSRGMSYTSQGSSTSTACDYDEVDTLAGSSRTKINPMGSLQSGSTATFVSATGSHRFVPGRPAMRLLVSRAIDRTVGKQRLAVVGCGPWAMMDDLRATIAASYGTHDGQLPAAQLEYFEDAFEW